MAKIEILSPFILSYEGGYCNVKGDRGGATKYGVTIATWKAQGYDKDGDGDIDVQDLKLISTKDAETIMKRNYWDRYRADEIKSQSIANLVVDWLWGSGSPAIKQVQYLVGVKQDGIVGPVTIAAINDCDPKLLFSRIHNLRRTFLNGIVKRSPSQQKFLKGWLRRLDAIQYGSLTLNTIPAKKVTFSNL